MIMSKTTKMTTPYKIATTLLSTAVGYTVGSTVYDKTNDVGLAAISSAATSYTTASCLTRLIENDCKFIEAFKL